MVEGIACNCCYRGKHECRRRRRLSPMCSNQNSDPLRCRRWITQGERPSLDERRRCWPHLDAGGGTRGGGSRGGAGRGARRLARRCRARSALPLKALRRRRRRLYCERGGVGWDAFFPPQAIPFSVSVVFLTCRSRHPVHTHICCNQNRIEVAITRHTALQLALDSDESDARGPFFAGRRAAHVLAAARGPRAGGCGTAQNGRGLFLSGAGAGGVFVVCAIAILITPCYILASPYIYIYIYIP